MVVKGTRLLLPKGGQSRRACQSKRQRGWWMSSCSLKNRPSGRLIAPTTSWCSMKCTNTLWTKGERRWSRQSAEAADRNCQSWTLKQTYLPSSCHPSKEEIQSLYLEVYKLWRQPGSPPGELELMEEVVSSFEDCQGQKQREAPEMAARTWSTDVQPQRSRTPSRGRRESSVERSLAKVREAHQKALAMAAALEEEIEWLTCPLIRSQSEVQAHSKSRDHCICRSRGQKRRHCLVQPEDCPAPYFEYHPSQRNLESGGEAVATEDPDLEELLELGPEGWLRIQKRKTRRHLLLSPQWKSYQNGSSGRLKPMKRLVGGGSWWRYWR